jgi:hypothetical protein
LIERNITWERIFELAKSSGKPQKFTAFPKYNSNGVLVNVTVYITPDGSEFEEEEGE